jgi:hypothetical protein
MGLSLERIRGRFAVIHDDSGKVVWWADDKAGAERALTHFCAEIAAGREPDEAVDETATAIAALAEGRKLTRAQWLAFAAIPWRWVRIKTARSEVAARFNMSSKGGKAPKTPRAWRQRANKLYPSIADWGDSIEESAKKLEKALGDAAPTRHTLREYVSGWRQNHSRRGS